MCTAINIGCSMDNTVYKIIVVGMSGVGKTSLIQYYKSGMKANQMGSTIGTEVYTNSIKIGKNKINLHIWDTAGQEKYESITTSFYRNSIGAIICFSLISLDSILSIEKYLNLIDQHSYCKSKIILIGTFLDKVEQDIDEKVYQILDKYNIGSYIKVSNITGENIFIAFDNLTNSIYCGINSGELEINKNSTKVIVHAKEISSKCCLTG